MIVTAGQLGKIMPRAGASTLTRFVDPLNAAMREYGITTERRIECFLPQFAHETGQLSALVENLNYSAKGLIGTWPKRFNEARAERYARHPEAIANYVYADRMGNGNEASGEGWKFRGRGGFMVTGKHNYIAAMMALGIDCVEHPELLEIPEHACRSAAWFWSAHGLNAVADRGDFDKTTKIINGGTIGRHERIGMWMVAQEVIA